MRATEHRPNQPWAAARGTQRDETARHAAHADLMGLLGALLRAGAVVPCLGKRAEWAAADDVTADAAATACLGCPALAACAAYVAAYPEPAGTWAGTTENQRTKSKGPTMTTNAEQTANLEALAIVRLIIRNEGDAAAKIMLTQTEDPVQLARAACGLAGALLLGLAPGSEEDILNKYTRAVVQNQGAGN